MGGNHALRHVIRESGGVMQETKCESEADKAMDMASNHAIVDWQAVAGHRLARLVESEHGESVLRERLNRLQADYREAIALNETRLRQIHVLEQRVHALGQLVGWRGVFRRDRGTEQPTGYVSDVLVGVKQFIKALLKAMARIELLRRVVGFVLGPVPRLRARLRSVTHGRG
jgi:hypothetical protein